MKKGLFTVILFHVVSVWSYAQSNATPEKMSYQAVVRNASNAPVTNQAVGMRISILQGSATGASVYVETQTPTSNVNGLISVEIGGGNVVSGNISSINWASGPYFIQTETDPSGGTNYTITGTSQLLSVPYALYAKTSGSSTPGPIGPQGVQGEIGAQGPAGADGQGVPTGGTAGQVLAKVDATDYNTQWITPVNSGWGLAGNTGTDANTNFIGTTDNQSLSFRTNNTLRWSITPNGRLLNNSTGNLFVGGGNETISGDGNTVFGFGALPINSSGAENTAIGNQTLTTNTSGGGNVALGRGALTANSTGNFNTAVGHGANVSSGNLSNATAIGRNAIVDASNKIRLGNDAVTATDIAGQVKVNAQSTTNNFTLPATRGTANQVLSTNGAGATSWVTPSSGGSAYPNIELDIRNNVNQSVTSLGNGTSANLITFSGSNSANASLTGGNVWNGNTFTVGANGAGWYQVNVQIVGVQADGVSSSNVGIPFYMDVNNTIGGTMSSAILYRSNYTLNTNASHLKNNNTITTLLHLSAGNTVNFYGFSASNTVTGNTSNNGSTYLNIVRLK